MKRLIACTFIVASASLGYGQGNKGLTDEDRKCFTWFDSLGFPDVSKLPLVNVSPGYWSQGAGHAPEKDEDEFAFLVKDEGSTFTVFRLATLATVVLTKTGPGTPDHKIVAYKRVDLKKEASDYLRRLREQENGRGSMYSAFQPLRERSVLFLWARACAGQKLDDLAVELLGVAKLQIDVRDRKNDGTELNDALSGDIARALIRAAVAKFGEPEGSREKLLANFKRVVTDFPKGDHIEYAKETIAILEKMIIEDKAHVRRTAKEFDNLTAKEKVAELIYRLRDLDEERVLFGDIFWDDHFPARQKPEKTAARMLAEMGYDAIPQLIESVDDDRFTRCFMSSIHATPDRYVLRVGDCALTILERIAGRKFGKRVPDGPSISIAEMRRSAKNEAVVWWQDIQKKGEKQVLIETTASGTENSPSQASRLVKQYPDAALEAIMQGLNNCQDDWRHARLVAIAAKLDGEKVTAFLREQLKARDRNSRAVAAAELLVRGQEIGLNAILKEWEEAHPPRGSEDEWELMIDFLAGCGKLEGIRALGENLDHRPIMVRFKIVESLTNEWPASLSMVSLQAHDGINWKFGANRSASTVQNAIDSVLVSLLDDEEEYPNGSYYNTFDPRICDCCAAMLAKRWKIVDDFDIHGTLRSRNCQRLQLKNVWLTRQGKAPILIPLSPRIEPAPESQIAPLLKLLRDAKSAKDAQEPVAQLLAIGLPALPAVRRALSSLAPSHPAYVETNNLAKRLSCTVRELHVAPESVAPTKDLKNRIDRLAGKPLEATAIVDLALAVIQELPPGVTGIKFIADREGDDTGITVTVTLTSTKRYQAGTQKGWSITGVFDAGKNCERSFGGWMAFGYGEQRSTWASCVDGLRDVLATSPSQPLLIRLSCIAEGD